MEFIIGVDAGGTKTEAVAYNQRGERISEGFAGFGNVVVNEEKAIANIMEAIQICTGSLNMEDCLYLYMGVAGFESTANAEGIIHTFKQALGKPVCIVQDSIIAHAALLKGQDGILTIAGTGSVSIGINGNHQAQTGGWGHLLGDEGSGYWIVMRAFKQMIKEEDGGLAFSSLTKALLEKMQITSVQDIKTFVYGSTKADVAQLVPVIVSEAQQGDVAAIQILKDAGSKLADLTWNVYKKCQFEHSVKVALKGSILVKIQLVQEEFCEILQNKLDLIHFITEDVSSTLGCYHLAIRELHK